MRNHHKFLKVISLVTAFTFIFSNSISYSSVPDISLSSLFVKEKPSMVRQGAAVKSSLALNALVEELMRRGVTVGGDDEIIAGKVAAIAKRVKSEQSSSFSRLNDRLGDLVPDMAQVKSELRSKPIKPGKMVSPHIDILGVQGGETMPLTLSDSQVRSGAQYYGTSAWTIGITAFFIMAMVLSIVQSSKSGKVSPSTTQPAAVVQPAPSESATSQSNRSELRETHDKRERLMGEINRLIVEERKAREEGNEDRVASLRHEMQDLRAKIEGLRGTTSGRSELRGFGEVVAGSLLAGVFSGTVAGALSHFVLSACGWDSEPSVQVSAPIGIVSGLVASIIAHWRLSRDLNRRKEIIFSFDHESAVDKAAPGKSEMRSGSDGMSDEARIAITALVLFSPSVYAVMPDYAKPTLLFLGGTGLLMVLVNFLTNAFLKVLQDRRNKISRTSQQVQSSNNSTLRSEMREDKKSPDLEGAALGAGAAAVGLLTITTLFLGLVISGLLGLSTSGYDRIFSTQPVASQPASAPSSASSTSQAASDERPISPRSELRQNRPGSGEPDLRPLGAKSELRSSANELITHIRERILNGEDSVYDHIFSIASYLRESLLELAQSEKSETTISDEEIKAQLQANFKELLQIAEYHPRGFDLEKDLGDIFSVEVRPGKPDAPRRIVVIHIAGESFEIATWGSRREDITRSQIDDLKLREVPLAFFKAVFTLLPLIPETRKLTEGLSAFVTQINALSPAERIKRTDWLLVDLRNEMGRLNEQNRRIAAAIVKESGEHNPNRHLIAKMISVFGNLLAVQIDIQDLLLNRITTSEGNGRLFAEELHRRLLDIVQKSLMDESDDRASSVSSVSGALHKEFNRVKMMKSQSNEDKEWMGFLWTVWYLIRIFNTRKVMDGQNAAWAPMANSDQKVPRRIKGLHQAQKTLQSLLLTHLVFLTKLKGIDFSFFKLLARRQDQTFASLFSLIPEQLRTNLSGETSSRSVSQTKFKSWPEGEAVQIEIDSQGPFRASSAVEVLKILQGHGIRANSGAHERVMEIDIDKRREVALWITSAQVSQWLNDIFRSELRQLREASLVKGEASSVGPDTRYASRDTQEARSELRQNRPGSGEPLSTPLASMSELRSAITINGTDVEFPSKFKTLGSVLDTLAEAGIEIGDIEVMWMDSHAVSLRHPQVRGEQVNGAPIEIRIRRQRSESSDEIGRILEGIQNARTESGEVGRQIREARRLVSGKDTGDANSVEIAAAQERLRELEERSEVLRKRLVSLNEQALTLGLTVTASSGRSELRSAHREPRQPSSTRMASMDELDKFGAKSELRAKLIGPIKRAINHIDIVLRDIGPAPEGLNYSDQVATLTQVRTQLQQVVQGEKLNARTMSDILDELNLLDNAITFHRLMDFDNADARTQRLMNSVRNNLRGALNTLGGLEFNGKQPEGSTTRKSPAKHAKSRSEMRRESSVPSPVASLSQSKALDERRVTSDESLTSARSELRSAHREPRQPSSTRMASMDELDKFGAKSELREIFAQLNPVEALPEKLHAEVLADMGRLRTMIESTQARQTAVSDAAPSRADLRSVSVIGPDLGRAVLPVLRVLARSEQRVVLFAGTEAEESIARAELRGIPGAENRIIVIGRGELRNARVALADAGINFVSYFGLNTAIDHGFGEQVAALLKELNSAVAFAAKFYRTANEFFASFGISELIARAAEKVAAKIALLVAA